MRDLALQKRVILLNTATSVSCHPPEVDPEFGKQEEEGFQRWQGLLLRAPTHRADVSHAWVCAIASKMINRWCRHTHEKGLRTQMTFVVEEGNILGDGSIPSRFPRRSFHRHLGIIYFLSG